MKQPLAERRLTAMVDRARTTMTARAATHSPAQGAQGGDRLTYDEEAS